MRNGRHRFGLIGLCVAAALVVTAFAAASAQAKPEWMVDGANVTGNLPVDLVITPEPLNPETGAEPHVALVSTALGQEVKILCETIIATGQQLLAGGVAHGTVSFEDCQTFLEGSLSKPCKPAEPINATWLLLISLHNGVAYTFAEPAAGKPFTVLSLGEECAIGEEYEITGQIWLEDCEGKAEVEQLEHLLEEGTEATDALGGLFYGEEPAEIRGSVIVELFDEGVMLPFSILAA